MNVALIREQMPGLTERARSGERGGKMFAGLGRVAGYEDPLYFPRVFRGVKDRTPTDYRRLRKG